MVFRTCAHAAVKLCQYEPSTGSVLWRLSNGGIAAWTLSSTLGRPNNATCLKEWSRSLLVPTRASHDTLSRAGLVQPLRIAASIRSPVVSFQSVASQDIHPRYGVRPNFFSAVSQRFVDEDTPQLQSGQPRRHEERPETPRTRESHHFVLPSSSGHLQVRRRRLKRPKWLMQVQALQHLIPPGNSSPQRGSPPHDGDTSTEFLSAYLLDCVHELRRVSCARAGFSDMRVLDHVQVGFCTFTILPHTRIFEHRTLTSLMH